MAMLNNQRVIVHWQHWHLKCQHVYLCGGSYAIVVAGGFGQRLSKLLLRVAYHVQAQTARFP